jgi:hypothetical protein
MATLTAVFDASGDKRSEVLAVAGFLSSESDWASFSEQWSRRLAEDHVKFFRAVDAAAFHGPFEHWKDRPNREELRRELSNDLMDILKRHVYHRFGCVVINRSLDKMSEELRKKFRLSAYSLAGLTCERHLRRYILKEWHGSRPEMPVRMVFEHGDEGFGSLCDWLTSAEGTIAVSRVYKQDTVQADGLKIPGFIPLQAADWLAYELGLSMRHLESGRLRKYSDLRWPMQEFTRVLGDAGTYSANEIRDVEKKLSAVENIPNWEKETDMVKLSEQFQNDL